MRTAQNDGVYLWIEAHQLVDALLDEVVGTRRVCLVILYQRYPERTGDTADLYVGVELVNLQVIRLTLDGSLGGKDADVAVVGQGTDDLCRRTNDAQDSTVGVELGQIILLYRT